MRILYFLLFVFALTSTASAQIPTGSELHIKLTDSKTPFIVSIDQRVYYNPDGYFSIGNLNGGLHAFKLYRYIPLSFNRIDSTLLICEGELFIQPSARMLIILDPHKHFIVSQYYTPLQYSMNTYLFSAVYSKYFAMIPYNCQDSTSYQAMLTQLKDMPFNDLKITLIKEAVFFYGIKSEQIKELIQLFPFDKDRVSLAVFCYGNCIDIQNFSLVNDYFSFTSSKQELRNQLIFYYNYGSPYFKK